MIIHRLKGTVCHCREKRRLRRSIIKLREDIQEQEALVKELEGVCSEDLCEVNRRLYKQALDEINYREQMAKLQVRQMIAEYLQQPTIAEKILGE